MSMKYFFLDRATLSKYHMHPLGKHLTAYGEHMHRQGFARNTGRRKIALIFKFSRWLKRYAVRADELTSDIIDRYVHRKGRKYRPSREESVALKQFAEFLHKQGVIASSLQLPIQRSANEKIADGFAVYLMRERGLSPGTIGQYKRHINLFLSETFRDKEPRLANLKVSDVVGYVRQRSGIVSRRVAKMLTTALRSFFQYARYQGYIETDLSNSVPAVANWAMVSIPRGLQRDQVERVLSSCDRDAAIGQRDYAILLMIARLGLRAGEIASLRLEDIDWRAGRITVHGKGSSVSQMPLPADVGEALAIYLRRVRPRSKSRSLFLRAKAPTVGFAGAGRICGIVASALRRAGIKTERYGAHQFRHSLATYLLQTGGSLPEIAELLRHQTIQCTTMYAKVDLNSLRTLGLPWPGGAQ